MIIAVDYDGTLCRERGKQKEINTALIQRLIASQSRGDTVILFTCRHGRSLHEAVSMCAKCGLMFNAVNNNTPETIDANELRCAIYLKPARLIEFIMIDMIAAKTGANFEEIVL